MAGTNLRRLGVYGDNLPEKQTRTVQPSDFQIGGVVGQFERKYNQSFEVDSVEKFREIFGDHVIATYYGWDAVKGFFDNAVGVDAKLFIVSQVGNDGSSIDAVVASRSISDSGTQPSLKAEAGYQTESEYGVGGNRTAVKLTAATRFATAAAATVAATGVSVATLDSVIGIKVGDIVRFVATGGVPGTEYHKITAVDETAKTVSWTGNFSASGATLAIDDVVDVPGFTVKTYRKSISGVETEVETDLGTVICTMESEVTDFYAPNVHATNRWIKLSDLASSSTLGDRSFASDSNPVYLTSGADGTAPTTAAHWDASLQLLNNDPIRFLINPEVTAQAINEAAETYCAGRTDTPIFIASVPENQTKAQLIVIGNNYQRSNEVDMIIPAHWLKVTDPFATSAIAPARHVPNVGHAMGAWVYTIGTHGIHYVPAVKTVPIRGIVGIVGDQFLDDADRTDLAEAGINCVQNLTGVGMVFRNWFTPSTNLAYQFGNGLLMRNYIKVSAVDSLQTSENLPNSLNRIREDRMALLQLYYRLWERGSTGNVPAGETFGQSEDANGNPTKPTEHFQVKADIVNNPQANINAGERNLDSWFSFPTPAGSIKIGVGVLLRS